MSRRVRNLRGTNAAQGITQVPPGANPHGVHFTNDFTFPVPVLTFFLMFLSDGLLADGTKSQQPLLSQEEARLYSVPYREWAPAGHRGQIRSAHTLGECLMVLSGLESFLLDSWSIDLETNIMKNRVLQGLLPISDRRWQQKQLDDPANFKQACQHLGNVVDAFVYINQEPFASKIRSRYNRMWDIIKFFETALNAKRAAEGQPAVRVVTLWDEYVQSHFAFVAARAHAWIARRVDKLQEATLARMAATGHALGPRNYSDAQMRVGDDMQDISEILTQADAACTLSTAGFKSEWTPPGPPPPGELPDWAAYDGKTPIPAVSPDLARRKAVLGLRMRWLNRVRFMDETMRRGPWRGLTSEPGDMVWSMREQLAAYADARRELRGDPPPLRMEHWIARVKGQLDSGAAQAWGFVGYRLYYKHSTEDWKRFLDAFKKDVQGWDRGVAGALWIKRFCRMRWLDGQELGIPEGDVEAARRHFATFKGSSDWIKGLNPAHFLVADEAAMESYINPGPEFLEPGDGGGFVVLSDSTFNPDLTSSDVPGFDGTVRVLGTLIWDSVYAGLSMMTFQGNDIWATAMIHPLQIYVGPLTKHQRQYFRQMNWFRNQGLVTALKWGLERPEVLDS